MQVLNYDCACILFIEVKIIKSYIGYLYFEVYMFDARLKLKNKF